MKKLISLILSSFLILPVFAGNAMAANFDMGLQLNVRQNTLGDSYYFGGKNEIDGDVFGDLYVLGGQVTISGDVHEDLIIIGGRVIITGNVGGDIRLIGGQVAIYGNVGSDVVAGGYQLDIGKSSVVGGDITAFVSLMTIDGVIEGGVSGNIGAFLLNGTVEKDVDISIQDALNMAAESSIGGDLAYSALLEVVLDKSNVDGRVIFKKFQFEPVHFLYEFGVMLAALILAAFFAVLFPKYLSRFANITRDNMFKSFGVGLLTAMLFVIIPLILMLTLVGIPIAMIGFGMILIFWFSMEVFVAALLASYFLNLKKKTSARKLFIVMAGMIFAYHVFALVPYLGIAVKFVLLAIALGGVTRTEFDYWKMLRSKNIL